MRDPRAVEPLIEALKDEDFDLRRAAAVALGNIKDPRAVEPLINFLERMRWRGSDLDKFIVALGNFDDLRAFEALLRFDDGAFAHNTCELVIKTLLKTNAPLAFKCLIKLLGNKHSKKSSREWAQHFLEEHFLEDIADPRAVEQLIQALRNENPNVRMVAAAALGRIKDPRAVEALTQASGDKSLEIPTKFVAPPVPTSAEEFEEILETENLEAVQHWLFESGFDVNHEFRDGFRPLHLIANQFNDQAARGKDTAFLLALTKLFLERKANPNVKIIPSGSTPLHIANSPVSKPLAELLFQHGVDGTIKDNFGRTPAESQQLECFHKSCSVAGM
jgi:ankyrin repeat protein